MMRLPRFQYLSPRNIREAVDILAHWGPQAAVVAGGTDLWPNMKRRQTTPTRVIGLRGVAELHGISGSPTGELRIGAMTTLAELERDARIDAAWPALGQASRLISTPPLRNMGTLGGNLCLDTRCNYYNQSYEWRKSIDFCLKKDGGICWVATSSPRCWAVASSDTAPVLSAIGAEVSLVSVDGERRLPVRELFRDDGIQYLNKRSNEILTAIHLPAARAGWRASYRKLRRRGSFDFPVLGVAAAVKLERGVVEGARVVLGAVESHPVVLDTRELIGKPLTADAVRAFAEAAARQARPMDNTDFDLAWRKKMVRSYVRGALEELTRA